MRFSDRFEKMCDNAWKEILKGGIDFSKVDMSMDEIAGIVQKEFAKKKREESNL